MIAVGMSTWIPSVKAVAIVITVMVMAAPSILMVAPRGMVTEVGITVKSHFLAGFHIYRNVGCGASGEEGCDGTFLQAVQDQRIRILTDAPVNQNGIGYKVNEKHAANQKGK